MKKRLYIVTIIFSVLISFIIMNRNNNVKLDNNITLYAASDSGDDTVTSIYMRNFAKNVEEFTDGKVVVKTFSSGTVGGDLELLEYCREGNISFIFQTSAVQASIIKEAEIFDLPGEFDDINQARNVIDSKIIPALKIKYANNGYELLGIADQGFRVMTSNKPIYNIGDLKGLKIRTMENRNHIDFWKNLGSNPTPMSYSEVYVGLQQGIIDAQENPMEAIIAPKFFEQQKYLVETNHLIHPVMCVGSKKIIDKLPYKHQNAIFQAAKNSQDEARILADIRNEENIDLIKDNGLEIIDINQKMKEQISDNNVALRKSIEMEVGEEFFKSVYSD